MCVVKRLMCVASGDACREPVDACQEAVDTPLEWLMYEERHFACKRMTLIWFCISGWSQIIINCIIIVVLSVMRR